MCFIDIFRTKHELEGIYKKIQKNINKNEIEDFNVVYNDEKKRGTN